MSDFYQVGVVATIHRLGEVDIERLERELRAYAGTRPIGLILPALMVEFERPAMNGIIEQLREVDWLKRVVVAVGQASEEQYREAAGRLRGFRTPVTALWMEHPRVEALWKQLEENGLSAGGAGKGRTCWLAEGLLLADGECEVIALHDCDIIGYSRDLLARLVYPLVHPNLPFEFAKGFYARYTDRLHGRVTRLFFTPLVRAIQNITPEIPYLRFLDSFRYALAGEFAMHKHLAAANRIPADWGLEVGVLAEVFRNTAVSRVCQVDISENYEHKHNPLSEGDPNGGLRKMTRDIAKSLFRTLGQEGVVLSPEFFRTLRVYYTRLAQDTIQRYYADALVNGLSFDRHAETSAVAVFAESIAEAARSFEEDPLGTPQIPNWNRVASGIPDIYEKLRGLAGEMERV
jgi:glucosyl-3-phosphoglycerate synthase